jgi:hypothetical protein
MEPRYAMLGLVQGVLRVLAWIIGVLGVIAAFMVLAQPDLTSLMMRLGPSGGRAIGFVAVLLITALYWALLLLYAELSSVIAQAEENTRKAATMLRTMQPPAGGPPPPGAPGPLAP